MWGRQGFEGSSSSRLWRHSQLTLEEIIIRMWGLDMWECEALEKFPSRVSTNKVLEELIICRCKSLKKLLERFGDLTCLKKLQK